jgi:alpha-L-fucosidase 2
MKKILFAFLLILQITAQAQDSAPLKLWYNTPSGKTWENALPIGNGRLGAMIYGNPEQEIIQLNEHTVWSGSPNRNDNPEALAALPQIRQLIFDGRYKEAEQLVGKTIITQKSHGQMFQPVGNLNLAFQGHNAFKNYYRELDLQRAVAKVSYTVGDVNYVREMVASLADRVIAVRLTASKSKSVSFTASFSTPQPNAKIQPQRRMNLLLAEQPSIMKE